MRFGDLDLGFRLYGAWGFRIKVRGDLRFRVHCLGLLDSASR